MKTYNVNMISSIKKYLFRFPILLSITKRIYFFLNRNKKFQSSSYWKLRYKKWWNSGAGSYGRLAKYKGEILNNFFRENNIQSAIEFGCWDGNNLKYYSIPRYVWLDISEHALSLCQEKFYNDQGKSFFLYHPYTHCDRHGIFSAQCGLSLDVVYHLIEDHIFEKYMIDLFSASQKFVIIYSSNTNINPNLQAQHVKHRNFTEWISKNLTNWLFLEKYKSIYTFQHDELEESFSDFYVFERVGNEQEFLGKSE